MARETIEITPSLTETGPRLVEEVRACDVRDGHVIWHELWKRFVVVVGRKQAGYSEIELHVDDGPDSALPQRYQLGEAVLRVVPDSAVISNG